MHSESEVDTEEGKRRHLLASILSFARGKPGIAASDYSSWQEYRKEARRVTAELRDVDRLVGYLESRPSITYSDIVKRITGRLQWNGHALSYITGQYYPAEYRGAVAMALVRVVVDSLMPSGDFNHRKYMQAKFGIRITRYYM